MYDGIVASQYRPREKMPKISTEISKRKYPRDATGGGRVARLPSVRSGVAAATAAAGAAVASAAAVAAAATTVAASTAVPAAPATVASAPPAPAAAPAAAMSCERET